MRIHWHKNSAVAMICEVSFDVFALVTRACRYAEESIGVSGCVTSQSQGGAVYRTILDLSIRSETIEWAPRAPSDGAVFVQVFLTSNESLWHIVPFRKKEIGPAKIA